MLPRSLLASLAPLALVACRSADGDTSKLTPEEVDEGWEVLFDGRSLEHWRGFKQDAVPEGWTVEEGSIGLTGRGAGDLITREQFESFELAFEWKISPRGNSGVMFHVTEDYDQTYFTGPEMQVIDNAVFDGDLDMLHAAGADYALHAPAADDTRPVGEFNQARILVDGDHVEYWLNGVRQCEFTLWSEDWRARVANSKFGSMPGYGVQRNGHIALQDHGNPVWYRNIRIRRL